ncbi:F-actin-monooxygenase MICAL1 isoform X3 [Accipiter gentilis]|uniref:F-actin-monooxygenase MICAL1 isoform X3 n=1 Tax=Astur gentilis TaxID=8957 RepID=UPI002110BAE2|nr:F-actin-monooxygenase MICAL1 isoform X3 [Accipiter gentilis]
MSVPADEPGNPAHAIFERFLRAGECREVLGCFGELCQQLGLQGSGLQLYHGLKAALNYWSAKALWSKLDKKAGHKDYDQGTACASTKCLVVGAGPCGLRVAIELALLGARVVLLEKRDSFSRNNVLHLWPFTIHDLRALGAKKFYGRFCTGTLDHISIRQLQLILLKVALLLGVEVHINVQFKGLVPPAGKAAGVLCCSPAPLPSAATSSTSSSQLVEANLSLKDSSGRRRGGSWPSASPPTSSTATAGLRWRWPRSAAWLESTIRSSSKTSTTKRDKADIESLLSPENVNRDALLSYAKEAANFSTNYRLPELEFALNHRDLPDVDMFDFTCMTRSENAALVREHNGARLLLGLVGDCLVEPFWPLGTGVARGFLAAFDAAWMVRRWAAGTPPLEVLAERESIYQHLSQTSPDNTNKNISQYSIDPATRYPNINLQAIKASQVRDLYLVGMVEVDHKRKSDNRLSTAVSGDAYEELLSWCQASTAGYHGVAVTDFTTSWTSGLALCALIHRFRPDLVDFDSMDAQDPIQTHQMMLDVAEQELGIQPVLSSAEMATMAEPDRLGLITYLSQFYEAFKTSPEVEEVSKKPLSPRGTRGAILFLSKLQKSWNLTHKRAQDGTQKDAEAKRSRRDAELDTGLDGDILDSAREPPQTAPTDPGQPPARGESSDACYFCGRRVYILERASAEGHFFHRGCFQCWRCGATLRLGDYAFNEEDGHFYCSLHYPNPPGMDLPQDEPLALPDGDAAAARLPSDAGSPCVSPKEGVPGPPQPPPAAPQPGGEPGAAEDAEDAGDMEEQELLAQAGGDAKEEEGPRAEPQGAAEEGEESGGRRKIVLTPLEKLKLSTLNLTSEAEPEPPPKPARLRLQAAPEALPALWQGQGTWEKEEEMAVEEALEESDSEEEEEEKEEEESTDLGIMADLYLDLGEEEKYPTWKRTLTRRAREAQMKRFCKAQAIQRRLEEIEVTFRELEQQGIKLEKLLRDEGGTPADQKTQWMNQLLYLVQKKNSLMSEESDLMIAVQELKLEEQQWQLDQKLRCYMNREESLKTPEERVAEQEILVQLLDVVNKRNVLIHIQEEKRLSELRA